MPTFQSNEVKIKLGPNLGIETVMIIVDEVDADPRKGKDYQEGERSHAVPVSI